MNSSHNEKLSEQSKYNGEQKRVIFFPHLGLRSEKIIRTITFKLEHKFKSWSALGSHVNMLRSQHNWFHHPSMRCFEFSLVKR